MFGLKILNVCKCHPGAHRAILSLRVPIVFKVTKKYFLNNNDT